MLKKLNNVGQKKYPIVLFKNSIILYINAGLKKEMYIDIYCMYSNTFRQFSFFFLL